MTILYLNQIDIFTRNPLALLGSNKNCHFIFFVSDVHLVLLVLPLLHLGLVSPLDAPHSHRLVDGGGVPLLQLLLLLLPLLLQALHVLLGQQAGHLGHVLVLLRTMLLLLLLLLSLLLLLQLFTPFLATPHLIKIIIFIQFLDTKITFLYFLGG